MRTASAQALETARLELDTALTREGGAIEVAEELFSLADLVAQHGALRRSLTDPARAVEDKQQLVTAVLEGKVRSATITVLRSLVASRWSREHDLDRALQELGCDAVIDAAARDNVLSEVQHQLGQVRNLLRETRELRIALSPASFYGKDQRGDLIEKLLGKDLGAYSLRLLQRLVSHPHSASLISALDEMASRVAHERNKRLVRVTSAHPLSEAQLGRLRDILTRKYGPVTINTAVNPEFLGGMRVRIGTDAIDGTLQADIAGVKQRLSV